MRDAMGGIFNLAFLVVFITVITGYLAFTISYSKAFKLKNKVISAIEQYGEVNEPVKTQVREYIEKIGYNTDIKDNQIDTIKKDSSSVTCIKELGFCYNKIDVKTEVGAYKKYYYHVVTFVSLDIPIFNKFLPYLKMFQTSGDTMTLYEKQYK